MSSGAEELPRMLGPYVLLERLGSGSFGTTYLAREPSALLPLVIKRLRVEVMHREDLRARLRHEAKVAVAIQDRHVVRAIDVGVVDDVPYMAMEYIDGWPLGEVLNASVAERRAWPSGAVVAVISQILEGVAALHSAVDPATGTKLEAVHRDLSPNNVMIRPNGDPVLIDLGLGRSTLGEWETRTDMLLGTPGYMAPEQILRRVVDHRADLYAIGVLAFELLTLERYVPSGAVAKMLRATCDGPFRAPSSVERSIPSALDVVLERALEVAPADRYDSAMSFRDALCAAVAPTPEVVAECVPQSLRRARSERNAARLALLAAPLPEPEEQIARTVVFARASRRAPTEVLPKVLVSEPTAAMEPVSITEPAMRPLEDEHTRSMEVGPTNEPTSPTRPLVAAPVPRAPRRSILAASALALMALSAGVTWWAIRSTATPSPAPAPAPSAPPATITASPGAIPAASPGAIPAASPGAIPAASPGAIPAAASPEPLAAEAPPPSERLGVRVPPRRPRPEPAVLPSSVPSASASTVPAVDPRARLEALIDRASARRRAQPDDAVVLDALIAEASAWLGSTDETRVMAAAERLERRLAERSLQAP